MRRIVVINQKGGVGKTTTCCNVGAALAAAGQRVLLIDLDPQAHLTIHLGVEPDGGQPSVYNVLTDRLELDQAVRPVRDNLWLVPAHIDLAAAELELVSVVGREVLLRDALRGTRGEYDFVLLDCPPSLGILTINGLAAMHEVVIPLQPHFLALQGVGKLLETISLVHERINPELRVHGVALCMYEAGTRLATEVTEDLSRFLDGHRNTATPWSAARVFRAIVRRNIKLAECPSHGLTIFDYAPRSNGALDYLALAAEIAGLPESAFAGVAALEGATAHATPAEPRSAVALPASAASAAGAAAQSEPVPPAVGESGSASAAAAPTSRGLSAGGTHARVKRSNPDSPLSQGEGRVAVRAAPATPPPVAGATPPLPEATVSAAAAPAIEGARQAGPKNRSAPRKARSKPVPPAALAARQVYGPDDLADGVAPTAAEPCVTLAEQPMAGARTGRVRSADQPADSTVAGGDRSARRVRCADQEGSATPADSAQSCATTEATTPPAASAVAVADPATTVAGSPAADSPAFDRVQPPPAKRAANGRFAPRRPTPVPNPSEAASG